MRSSTQVWAAVAVAAAMLSGCVAAPLPPGSPTAAASRPAEYKLAAGDKLKVTTFNEPTLSGEFTVGADGSISMPLVGTIPAGGLTTSQLQTAVESQLTAGGFVARPRVSAEVIEYRPYYIFGEVARPNQYPYQAGLTASQAIATAGGFTYRADQRRIFVTRAGTTAEEVVPFTAATPIGPGDTIRVGERSF